MLPIDIISSFFLVALLLALSPGPDNIFVLTQSVLHGRAAGLLVTLGLASGILVHTAAVALGVAVLVATSATLFTVIKIIGAAYLLYLAWQAFHAGSMAMDGKPLPALSASQLYVRGFIMNVTNPKVAIFFLAFLPQFTHIDRGPLPLQMMQLGVLFMLATLLMFGSIALLAGHIGPKLNNSGKMQRILNRAAAFIFAALAVKLLFTRQ